MFVLSLSLSLSLSFLVYAYIYTHYIYIYIYIYVHTHMCDPVYFAESSRRTMHLHASQSLQTLHQVMRSLFVFQVVSSESVTVATTQMSPVQLVEELDSTPLRAHGSRSASHKIP